MMSLLNLNDRKKSAIKHAIKDANQIIPTHVNHFIFHMVCFSCDFISDSALFADFEFIFVSDWKSNTQFN